MVVKAVSDMYWYDSDSAAEAEDSNSTVEVKDNVDSTVGVDDNGDSTTEVENDIILI